MPHPILVIFLLAYSVVHSLLASQPAKRWAQRVWGPASARWYRLAYTALATITLLPLPLLLLWLPDQLLYTVPAPWSWLLLAGQTAALVGFLLALRQTNLGYFLGTAQLAQRDPSAPDQLVTDGLYAYVRHPLYAFGLPLMWLTPTMTVNWLTVFAVFTCYLYVGSFHEEQRLLADFGPDYRAYQRRVGRFVPRVRWPGRDTQARP